MSPQVAECSLNAARVVKLMKMFLHVEHLCFNICILSEAAIVATSLKLRVIQLV